MEHVYGCTGHALKIPNIVDSEGVYLFDDTGKRYMDLESGVWCISIGHKNEQINRSITKQIGTLMHAGFCYSNQILEEASKAILDVTRFVDGQCVFLCSGSEAIEISRQIARHLTGKKKIHDASRFIISNRSATYSDRSGILRICGCVYGLRDII